MVVEEGMLWNLSPYLSFEALSTLGAGGREWSPVDVLGVSLELKGLSNFPSRGWDFVGTQG